MVIHLPLPTLLTGHPRSLITTGVWEMSQGGRDLILTAFPFVLFEFICLEHVLFSMNTKVSWLGALRRRTLSAVNDGAS